MPSQRKSKLALESFPEGQTIVLTTGNWWSEINRKMKLCDKCKEVITAATACYLHKAFPSVKSSHVISDSDLKILQKKFPKIMFDGEELSFDRDSSNFLFLKRALKNQVQTA